MLLRQPILTPILTLSFLVFLLLSMGTALTPGGSKGGRDGGSGGCGGRAGTGGAGGSQGTRGAVTAGIPQ